MNQVYALWKKAVPLLQGQPFTHWLYTHGMRNVKGKPRKVDMQPCTFTTIRPELCFLLLSKGEYYELELRFTAKGKTYRSCSVSLTFFIHSEAQPNQFYLLDCITDYHVVSFFTKYNFKLSVLKCHYDGHLKVLLIGWQQLLNYSIKGLLCYLFQLTQIDSDLTINI